MDNFGGGSTIVLEGVEVLFWVVCREFWVLKPVDDQELCCDGNPKVSPTDDPETSYNVS